MEFIIAVNNAADADLSRISANSPSDAVFMAAAWAAVFPTMSRFSLNAVNCSPARVRFSRADCKDVMRSLHEQRRYSSFFNWQNWSMHAKYAVLHCSYSAPVRVSLVARATVAVRAVVVRLVFARDAVFVWGIAARTDVFCVATRTDGRDATVFVFTRWVVVAARIVGDVLCTRDAAMPPVVKKAQKTSITPILVISDKNFSKFQKTVASKLSLFFHNKSPIFIKKIIKKC